MREIDMREVVKPGDPSPAGIVVSERLIVREGPAFRAFVWGACRLPQPVWPVAWGSVRPAVSEETRE